MQLLMVLALRVEIYGGSLRQVQRLRLPGHAALGYIQVSSDLHRDLLNLPDSLHPRNQADPSPTNVL